MRLFIALDLEDNDYFLDIQDKIPKDTAKITLPKTFHLTLKFLGDIPEKDILGIKEKLKSIKVDKICLTTEEIGAFPSKDYMKVIWVGIKEKEAVCLLQQEIEKALLDIFPKDERFHPHITLARVLFVRDKEMFKSAVNSLSFGPKQFKVDSFRLVKSTLTGNGPVYEVLESFKLGS